jgi:alkylhydroperoxidase family enzyme
VIEPRLPLLSAEEAHAAAEQIGIDPKYLTQPIWTMLLARPKLAKPVYDLLTDLLFRGNMPVRTRELLIMRIAWTTGSEFEWAQHWKVATSAGVAPEAIVGVREWESSDLYSDAERAVLCATDDVVREAAISKASFAALSEHFDEAILLELTAAIATWFFISVIARSLCVPLDEGMSSWPPDGVGP